MRLIVGIETSCDETSIALLQAPETTPVASYNPNFLAYLNGFTVVSHVISSQASKFAKYGGVIPEISARGHAEQIFGLWDLVLAEASLTLQLSKDEVLKSITEIAVTTEPGLVSALKVGLEFGKVLCFHLSKNRNVPSLIQVNHLHGHIASCFYNTTEQRADTEIFPHLHLLVSGGNTQLLLMKTPTDFEIVARTMDDAAGECLDKIGRMVGVDYPAGGTIARIVGERTDNPIDLPVGLEGKPQLAFSYSGLKTAVRYYIRDHSETGVEYEKKLSSANLDYLLNHSEQTLELKTICDILTSTQTVVVEQLINQTKKAIKLYNPKSLGLSGGVSANRLLRSELMKLHPNFFLAPLELTGDNAVMIVLAYSATRYPAHI